MTALLQRATAEAERLSEADQEQIGRQLLSHIEKLRQLRAELDRGLRSLDAGKGEPLDTEQSLRELLTEAAKPGRAELIAELERIRAMTPPRKPDMTYPTAEQLVREDRDNR